MDRIYLDNAATTPVATEVRKAMKPYFKKYYGNPSALHHEGVVVRKAVQEARDTIGGILQCQSDEVIFTGSGTESVNLAIVGAIKYFAKRYPGKQPHIITSAIEHSAVIETCRALEEYGVTVDYISVSKEGVVNVKELEDRLRDTTVLVSVMYANNEIGTVQPISDITKAVRRFQKTMKTEGERGARFPYVHTDACQAPNYLDLATPRLGVDMMTLNGSKVYGPKGVGVLFRRRHVELLSLMHGGKQEFGVRPGTENVPGIVGMAKALALAEEKKESEIARLTDLRNFFIDALLAGVEGSVLNGSRDMRLSNNVHVSILDTESEQLVIELDAKGVACSSRSACKAKDAHGSHVLQAIGNIDPHAGSLRFTFGRFTTKEDLRYTVDALKKIMEKVKRQKRLNRSSIYQF